MAQRIKGQEVEVVVVLNGEPQANLFAIRSFEIEEQLEIQSEGYLGETTNRRDSIYNGVRGRLEAHTETPEWLGFSEALKAKAQRREPGSVINIKGTLNYPSGEQGRFVIPDAEFGAVPMNFGSRSDYGTLTLEFEAAQLQRI